MVLSCQGFSGLYSAFFFLCYSCEPEMLSLGFLWHCGGGIVVAIVGIARDKQWFSLLKAFNQCNN